MRGHNVLDSRLRIQVSAAVLSFCYWICSDADIRSFACDGVQSLRL